MGELPSAAWARVLRFVGDVTRDDAATVREEFSGTASGEDVREQLQGTPEHPQRV